MSNILSYFGGATVESKGIDSLEPLLDLVSMLGPRGVLPEVPNAYESPTQVGMVRVLYIYIYTHTSKLGTCKLGNVLPGKS